MSFRRRPHKAKLRYSKSFDPTVLNNNVNSKVEEKEPQDSGFFSLASDHSEKTFRTARIQRSWSREVHNGTASNTNNGSPVKKTSPRILRGKLKRAHTMSGEVSERSQSFRSTRIQRSWSRDVVTPGRLSFASSHNNNNNDPLIPRRASTIAKEPSLHKTEDCFWTSPTVMATVLFLAIAVARRDTRFVLPALVLFLAKAGLRIAKWIAFVAKNEDLKEVVEITKGYIELLWGHVVVFIDKKQGGSRITRFGKKVTAGLVMHYHETQYNIMTKFLDQRKKRATKV